MLKILLGKAKRQKASVPGYDETKELARHNDPEVRRQLARRTDVRPEILYFLAEDASPDVRREIASNDSTPVQADMLLARDEDDEVRCELARKIARLLPTLTEDARHRLRDMTLEILDVLAQDQLPKVRAILSEEVKSSRAVSRTVVKRLAHDVEEIVSVPVLQYSPLLNDQDLLEIIAGAAARGVLSAISRRPEVSESVSDAIVATMDAPAVAALLANPSAQIREETLDAVIDNAAEIESWHGPLVCRPDLSLRAIRRIAGFVALSLVNTLMERNNLDQETVAELNRAVRRRIDGGEADSTLSAEQRVTNLAEAGGLGDAAICDAIDRGDREFTKHALSVESRLALDVVDRILHSRSPRPVTAVAWRAGLSMRTAMQLQLRVAKVPPGEILNARNGVDFPMSEAEMLEQLDLFVD